MKLNLVSFINYCACWIYNAIFIGSVNINKRLLFFPYSIIPSRNDIWNKLYCISYKSCNYEYFMLIWYADLRQLLKMNCSFTTSKMRITKVQMIYSHAPDIVINFAPKTDRMAKLPTSKCRKTTIYFLNVGRRNMYIVLK